ncbi:hypothetical protein HAX54_043041 [Datura stramonium]|uniref:Uncharacterized protein n=1 Tax=Datura stramonium TaxID=4076 RepID=A0ABS8SMW1_DATST|nr:hypothetical protein [Datura stramonium]
MMMEEHELEEGEACYYKDDEDTSIDPDIALSYIGQNLVGKGSFLPTYQRSPSILSQPRTPQRSQNQGTSRSPNRLASEGPPQNSTAVSDPPSTRRNGTAGSRDGHTLHDSRVPCGDDSTRKFMLFAQESNKFPAKHEVSMIKSLNLTDQRKLKLRIRVGSDKTAQKSTALQTSLAYFPLHRWKIVLLRVVRCCRSFKKFTVILQPASFRILILTVMSANSSTSRLEDGDVLIRKKTKSKNLGIESLENRHCFSNDLNRRVVPGLVCDTHESVKAAGGAPEAIKDSEKEVPMKKREINRLKDQLFGSDLDKDDSLESLFDLKCDKYDHQEEGGRSKCSRSVPSFRADSDISESERDSKHQPGLKPAANVAEVRRVPATLKNKKSSKKDVRVAHVPCNKVDSHVACATPMKDPSAVGIQGMKELASGAEPPVAPVVIEEDWVAQIMPGMNRCDISEEETTRALHALYQMPLPDNLNSLQNHAGRSVAGVVSADMHGLGVLTTKSNLQHELVKSRSSKNVNQPVAEPNSISNQCTVPVKSSDVLGKHLNKSKERMANGDEKPKSIQKESDQYDQRDSKKKLKIKSDQVLWQLGSCDRYPGIP